TGRGGAGKGEHAKGRGNEGGERCSFLVRHDVSLSDECREADRSESRGRSQDVRINLAAMGVSGANGSPRTAVRLQWGYGKRTGWLSTVAAPLRGIHMGTGPRDACQWSGIAFP